MALKLDERPDTRDEDFYEADLNGRPLDEDEAAKFDEMTSPENYSKTADLRNAEESPKEGWKNKVGNAASGAANIASATPIGRGAKLVMTIKKRGPAGAIVGVVAIAAFAVFMFLGPAALIMNLVANASIKNNTTAKSFSTRAAHTLAGATNNTEEMDSLCGKEAVTTNIKCKMGRLTNKALNDMHQKGVTAIFDGADGTKYDPKNRSGYPDKQPTHYEFVDKDGVTQRIPAGKFGETLVSRGNLILGAKVLGIGGAFNMYKRTLMGKHVYEKLYHKFNLSRKGGLADGEWREKYTAKQMLDDVKEKLKTKIPSIEKAEKGIGVAKRLKDKVNKHAGKLKAGGIAYAVAAGACVVIKIPGFLAAAVAAVQLQQLLQFPMEVVNSPGDKVKVSGLDPEHAATPEDMDAIGTILTHQTLNQDNKMTAAVDSKYFQYATGVNTVMPTVHPQYTPGMVVLSHDAVMASIQLNKAAEPACNVILSPAAMATALVASAVFAAMTAGVGGLLNVLGGLAVDAAISAAVAIAIEHWVPPIIKSMANVGMEQAEGEALGDVLGVGMIALYASLGMSRHLPVLREDEVESVQMMYREQDNYERQMDIASLSPWDTSSQHTFMGSIFHNLQTSFVRSGGYKMSSVLPTVFGAAPGFATAHAQNYPLYTEGFCNYAEDFGLNTEEQEDNPGITLSGLPCTGALPIQMGANMDEAIDSMIAEGWICDGEGCPEIGENDSILDLMPDDDDFNGNGYIKPDTPLYHYIASCSDPSTGDYLLNSAGCVTPGEAGDPSTVECSAAECENTSTGPGSGGDTPTTANTRSLQLMTTFLMDYQIIAGVNGQDNVESGSADGDGSGNGSDGSGGGGGSGDGSGGGGGSGGFDGNWHPPLDRNGYNARTYGGHRGIDFGYEGVTKGTPIYAVGGGTVIEADDSCADDSGCGGQWQGNYVVIKHDDSTYTAYVHMARGSLKVKTGDTVGAGQHIGSVGNTGQSFGNHLHFEYRTGPSHGYGDRPGDQASFQFLKERGILPNPQQQSLIWD